MRCALRIRTVFVRGGREDSSPSGTRGYQFILVLHWGAPLIMRIIVCAVVVSCFAVGRASEGSGDVEYRLRAWGIVAIFA